MPQLGEDTPTYRPHARVRTFSCADNSTFTTEARYATYFYSTYREPDLGCFVRSCFCSKRYLQRNGHGCSSQPQRIHAVTREPSLEHPSPSLTAGPELGNPP